LVHAVSITDEKALKAVAAAVGTWDVLVIGAAYVASPAPVAQSSVDDWWQTFEVRRTVTIFFFLADSSLRPTSKAP
jgi:NAD(P)-dependent dehydrogenase (short-subunit alcohol dehydrogenase family)